MIRLSSVLFPLFAQPKLSMLYKGLSKVEGRTKRKLDSSGCFNIGSSPGWREKRVAEG